LNEVQKRKKKAVQNYLLGRFIDLWYGPKNITQGGGGKRKIGKKEGGNRPQLH